MIKIDCNKCKGSGWCWWYELDHYSGPASDPHDCYSDDTKYNCDNCRGRGYTLKLTKVDLYLEDVETFKFINENEMFEKDEWEHFTVDVPEEFYVNYELIVKEYQARVEGYRKIIEDFQKTL